MSIDWPEERFRREESIQRLSRLLDRHRGGDVELRTGSGRYLSGQVYNRVDGELFLRGSQEGDGLTAVRVDEIEHVDFGEEPPWILPP